eukprot:6195524-Pleurochrysis_carterae.AAC.5
MVMDDTDDDDNVAATPDVAAGMETDSDGDNSAPAAGMDETIASCVHRHGAPRPFVPQTAFAFNPPHGVLHTHIVPARATSIDMCSTIEPEPMQADLPMQSDPGALASFNDIANIADVNERNEWYRAHHYAEIDGLFSIPAGLLLVPRPPHLTMILQLGTLYKIKADVRKKARCLLGGAPPERGSRL